jgi:hypothetical protein
MRWNRNLTVSTIGIVGIAGWMAWMKGCFHHEERMPHLVLADEPELVQAKQSRHFGPMQNFARIAGQICGEGKLRLMSDFWFCQIEDRGTNYKFTMWANKDGMLDHLSLDFESTDPHDRYVIGRPTACSTIIPDLRELLPAMLGNQNAEKVIENLPKSVGENAAWVDSEPIVIVENGFNGSCSFAMWFREVRK